MSQRYKIGRYITVLIFQVRHTGIYFVIAQDTTATEELVIEEVVEDEVTDDEVIDEEVIDEEVIDEEVIEYKIIEDEIIENEIIENEIIEDEIIEDEIIEDEIIEDEIVEDEIIEDEIIEDEVVEDEIIEDEIIEDEVVEDEVYTLYDTDTGVEIRLDENGTGVVLPGTLGTGTKIDSPEKGTGIVLSGTVLPDDAVNKEIQKDNTKSALLISGTSTTKPIDFDIKNSDILILQEDLLLETNEEYMFDEGTITYIEFDENQKRGNNLGKQAQSMSSRKDIQRKATGFFQAETSIKSMSKGIVNLNDITVRVSEAHAGEFGDSRLGGIALGPDDDHLVFSKPVRLEIPIHPEFNDLEVEVLVEHLGDTYINTSGLSTNPNAVCTPTGEIEDQKKEDNIATVTNGIVTIYTCGASTFTVTYIGGADIDNFVDNNTLDKTITVLAGGSITDVNVIIDFHTIDGTNPASPGGGSAYGSEISFVLESPTGTIVNLLNDSVYGDANAPRVTVTFDDAAGPLPSGTPSSGTFRPAGNLSDFNTEDPVGDRILTMGDDTNDDGIILFSATLEITDNVVCGDSTLNGAEGCDDGNTTNGDGCSDTCLVETTYACNTSGNGAEYDIGCVSEVCDQNETTPTCEPINTCGNGTIEGVEECDDGNTNNGDGCTSTCLINYCGNSSINSAAVFTTIFSEDFESNNGTTQTSNTTLISTASHTLTYENSGTRGRVRYGTNAVQDNGGVGAATLDVTPNGTFITNYLIFETDLSGVSGASDIELTFDRSDHGDEDHPQDIVEIRGSNSDTWINVYDRKTNDIGNGTFQSVTIDIDDFLTINSQFATSTFQIRFGQNDNFAASSTTADDGLTVDNVEVKGTVAGPATTEACDDGNATNGDGCSDTCTIEPGFSCTGEPSVCYVCGDGVIQGGEACDDGNTANGDGCDSMCQIETDRQCSGAPSSCLNCGTDKIIVGYNISNVDETTQSISYSSFTNNTYDSTPIVLATPQTDNSTNNYPIPVISNVTTGGFDISICLDEGDTTCAASPASENVSIFVVDTDRAACVDHIEAGTRSVSTNGGNTAFTFASGFTNVPYVFTTPQTSNQGGNIAAIAWVDDAGLSTNGGNFVGCVHQNGNSGNVDACSTGQPNETLGWVAIDPVLFSMTGAQRGTQSIANSTWTNINFSPTYTTPPAVMVTQNSDNGAQDPQYAWARDVTTSSADIRYCEADAGGVCNSHANEDVRRFSLDIITCGNDILDSGETCDDGNTTNGDGSDNTCQIETICGDGIIEVGEECDDNNTTNGDGCSDVCLLENPANCGNGIINGGETCDDNNTTNSDGCNQYCQIENGYICPQTSNCGNNIINEGEQCDDGNTIDGDGCSQYCIDEFNFLLTTFSGESLLKNPTPGGGLDEPIWSFSAGGYEASVSNSTNPYAHVLYSPFNFWSLAAPRALELAFQGSSDDDFIGYVFGWQPGDWNNPNADFILVTRKDADQTFDFTDDPVAGGQADQGLAIIRVQGEVSYDELWQHIDSPNTSGSVTELARGTNYGNVGYTPDLYDTSVFYNTGKIDVYVSGALDISLTGDFYDGRFGIFIMAQQGNTFALGKPHPYALGGGCYAECGDGIIIDNETCDDGNTTNGDGCSEFCSIETPDECALGTDTCNNLETCYNSYEGFDCVCEEPGGCDGGLTGDICLFSPTSFNFSGSITSEYTETIFEQQFAESFQVEDSSGSDSGWYTTLQIGDFSGSTHGDTISNSNLEWYSTGMTLFSGDANTDVMLATGRSSYRTADSIYTFILRDPGANSGRVGTYETFPRLRLTLPAYTKPDIYQTEITYTLFEN